MRQTLINGLWPLKLPDHRADFHEVRPWWEAARLTDMRSYLAEVWWPEHQALGPPSIIDIGSEEGDLSALYASWGADVYCIDPSRPWIAQTIETFTANGMTPPLSFTGFADYYNHINGKPIEDPRFGDIEEEGIARIRLDTFCEWFDIKPAAVVMDVEGNELRVLEGAGLLLTEDIVWWISIHGDVDPHDPIAPSPVHEFMRARGFKDQWLGHQHEWFYRFYRMGSM